MLSQWAASRHSFFSKSGPPAFGGLCSVSILSSIGLEMNGDALAIQVAGGAASLNPIAVGLTVGHEKGIDLDDRVDLVAVLFVGGVFGADPVDAAVVIVPGGTHAYALGLAEFCVLGMTGDLVALDHDDSFDRCVFGCVTGLDIGVF